MSKRPFHTFLKLAIALQELRDNDSPEADALRDEMDEPWEQLNSRQRSLCQGVSAELIQEKRS